MTDDKSIHIGENMGLSMDNVELQEWDLDDLRELHPDWDNLSNKEKYQILTAARSRGKVEPTYEDTSHNTPTVGMRRTIIRTFDPNQQEDDISYLALGDANDPVPAFTDEALVNEQARVPVTRIEDADTELLVATFVSSTQAAGVTIRELGLVAEDLLNRSLLDAFEKTPETALTVEVRLRFEPQAEATV